MPNVLTKAFLMRLLTPASPLKYRASPKQSS